MTRVSILQLEATAGTVQDTLPRIEDALARAAADGATLLVAPELATTGYGAGDEFARLAEDAGGQTIARLQTVVDRTGVALVAGVAERADGRVYNAAAVLRPATKPVFYRKAQLYGPYEKGCFAEAPLGDTVFQVAGLTVGVLVCFDVEYPEHVRRLAQAGCDLVAVPTALPDMETSVFVAERVVPVRAFENQVFVAYADWSGRDDRFGYAGRSCLVAPDARELLRAPARGGYFGTATVDPSAYAESRAENPYLAELRVPPVQAKRAAE